MSFRVLSPVTSSGPINGPQISSGVVLGLISHTVDISQLGVAVSLSLSIHRTCCNHLLQ